MTATGVWYATRADVKFCLEILGSSRSNRVIDQKLAYATLSVEEQLHRRFYPELRTINVDWPDNSYGPTWDIQLWNNELISLTSLTAGGSAIPTNKLFLRRGDDIAEPPYDRIEVDLSSAYSLQAGTTFQRSIAIAGLFSGDKDTDTSLAGGALGSSPNSSTNTITINPASGVLTPDAGSLLLIGTERLSVADTQFSDTTANTAGTIAAQKSAVTLATDSSAWAINEVIQVDSERMRIAAITGTTLTVERAVDGTVLAAHGSVTTDIYAARTFIVRRGILGSTAAAHNSTDPVYVHEYPGPVHELCLAEAVCALENNSAAWARVVGSGDNQREAAGKGLLDVRLSAYNACGRKGRIGAI